MNTEQIEQTADLILERYLAERERWPVVEYHERLRRLIIEELRRALRESGNGPATTSR